MPFFRFKGNDWGFAQFPLLGFPSSLCGGVNIVFMNLLQRDKSKAGNPGISGSRQGLGQRSKRFPLLLSFQKLFCQLLIALCTQRTRVIQVDGQTVAGCFAQTDVARNDGLIHLVFKDLANLLRDLHT